MMGMKRYLACMAIGLLAVCSVATADEYVPLALPLTSAHAQAVDQAHAGYALVSAVTAAVSAQPGESEGTVAANTWRMRSDMRVAGAGMVLKSVDASGVGAPNYTAGSRQLPS